MNPEIFGEFVTLRERNGICAPLTHRFKGATLKVGDSATCQCGDMTVVLRPEMLTATIKVSNPISFSPGALSITMD